MKNKTYEIDAAMALKKYYCHKCGSLLKKHQRKRLIKTVDPDYKEHRTVGRMNIIGDIELTEYDFLCPICNKIISVTNKIKK
jgi:transcription initiation factor IIE alpha subunit